MAIIFASEFNNFQPINGAQAWSLFFTGGKRVTALGHEMVTGRYFTGGLV